MSFPPRQSKCALSLRTLISNPAERASGGKEAAEELRELVLSEYPYAVPACFTFGRSSRAFRFPVAPFSVDISRGQSVISVVCCCFEEISGIMRHLRAETGAYSARPSVRRTRNGLAIGSNLLAGSFCQNRFPARIKPQGFPRSANLARIATQTATYVRARRLAGAGESVDRP